MSGLEAVLKDAARPAKLPVDPRAALEDEYGEVWTTEEAVKAFEFISFCAPVVDVIRRSDGARGYLIFQHSPRLYYGFTPERGQY